jgi:hypothetical protein
MDVTSKLPILSAYHGHVEWPGDDCFIARPNKVG